MTDTGKRKFTMLAATGLAALSLGGTLIVADAVQPPVTTYAATDLVTAKKSLEIYLDKGKIILANKTVTGQARGVVQDYQDMGNESYNSGDIKEVLGMTKTLKNYYDVNFDSKGNTIDGKASDSTDVDDMGSNIATAEEPGVSKPQTDSNSNSSNPIKDTQDARKYEESTAQEANGGSQSTDGNVDSNSNSGSSTENSSSTKPDSHSTSEFSKESINAPGNSGSTTASSNASSTIPTAKSDSKKGNLPGTGEDSGQAFLIATIGFLGILGLGGTALALWLRQRKHVNNE